MRPVVFFVRFLRSRLELSSRPVVIISILAPGGHYLDTGPMSSGVGCIFRDFFEHSSAVLSTGAFIFTSSTPRFFFHKAALADYLFVVHDSGAGDGRGEEE